MSDWIKTNGVPPTLDANTWVRIRWRDGMELEGPAGVFAGWGAVVAYRLLPPKALTPTGKTVPHSALAVQEGGGHYKDLKIQPIEYIHANGIPFAEGCAIKYLTRWRSKGGVEDLKKARHFIDLLLELEGRNV